MLIKSTAMSDRNTIQVILKKKNRRTLRNVNLVQQLTIVQTWISVNMHILLATL